MGSSKKKKKKLLDHSSELITKHKNYFNKCLSNYNKFFNYESKNLIL